MRLLKPQPGPEHVEIAAHFGDDLRANAIAREEKQGLGHGEMVLGRSAPLR
jgi:hypothetical protein